MTCTAKHTEYQPKPEEYICPDCGRKSTDNPQGLAIDESVDESYSCSLLHEQDYLCCYSCGYEITGGSWATRLQKAMKLVLCAHCNGTGLMKREQ